MALVPSLEAAEERWRLTIDNAPVGIALVSLEGQFMRVNDALCSMLGYTADELHELTFQRITHPEDLGADLHLLQQLVDAEINDYSMRKRYLHRDGRIIWVDLSVGLVRKPDGRPLHFVSHVLDRSDEVEAAARIDQINRDLSEESTKLARSNADLEAFAMLASHDLQAPLTTIKGYLEALGDEYAEVLDPRAQGWIEKVTDSVDRMAELVSSLLAFSRAGHAPERELVSVPELLALVVQDLDQLVVANGARVEWAEGSPAVLAERSRLRQVLQNLVQNAIKYRRPDRAPHCVVAVVEQESGWLITVEDNALGVPPEQREEIFSLFARVEGAEAGHGIGLAACRQIIERHGGHIWVEDHPSGTGSRFAFTLPR